MAYYGWLCSQVPEKGSTIYLERKIKIRSYDDKDGRKRYVTEIIADSFIMLDKPEEIHP